MTPPTAVVVAAPTTAPPVTIVTPLLLPPDELQVVIAPAPRFIVIGTDAFAWYVPATTLSMVNRPSSPLGARDAPGPMNTPLRGSFMSMTNAPTTGVPSSSTTTPDTRNAGSDC